MGWFAASKPVIRFAVFVSWPLGASSGRSLRCVSAIRAACACSWWVAFTATSTRVSPSCVRRWERRWARALASAGLAVLLFDYRGYGGNPGRPSDEGLAHDVRAAHRFLIGEVEVALARLPYYGESLGSAVVTELATERPPAGLVLRSPFVDLASVGRVHYPFLPVRDPAS
jgi:fermentation-respiration switch protein FrsA (DUF1100 family)